MSAPAPGSDAAVAERRSNTRRWLLVVAAIGFLGLGAGYGVWWERVGRFEVSTDDAYAAGNVIQVTPQVSGTIVAVNADDTDFVQAGQVLVAIDDTDARLALEQAKAELAETVREVKALFSTDAALAAVVAAREATLARAEEDLVRRQRLASTGAVSAEELKHARDTLQEVQAELIGARRQADANRVMIDNTTIPDHPRVLRAASKLRDAWLAWRRCSVLAPVSGQVARRSAQLGQRTTPGIPLMTIVPLEQVWVDANFKEAQLREMRIGQSAELTADLYGGGVVYHGRVAGLAAGTGGAFSLLPAQNASGNWLKIVQRVPVRIALDPAEVAAHPLRIGLSVQVEVRIEDQSGERLSAGRQTDTALSTTVFSDMDRDAGALIARIIADNSEAAAQAVPTAAAAR